MSRNPAHAALADEEPCVPLDRETEPGRATVNPTDEQLDAELEQTFPASDPLPWTHLVD